jgi:PKD repeat protein
MGIQQILFSAALAVSLCSHAATYYVDPVSGDDSRTNLQATSTSTPWKSIPGSYSHVNANVALPTHSLSPGDTVEVKGGTTIGAVNNVGRLDFIQSGTATAPITIKCSTSFGSGACTFSGAGVALPGADWGVVTFSSASYVKLSGFTMSSSTENAIFIQGSSHHITIGGANAGEGNNVLGATKRCLMVSIATQMPQPPTFLRILKNTFANCASGGVVLWRAPGGYTLVEGNTFNNVLGGGNFDIIQVGGFSAGTHHAVVRNNTINGGGTDGDPIDTSGHGITHNILIEGNRVIDAAGNLKFHCAVAESTLTPGYDQGLYGPPGSAGWYSPGVSCHLIIRHNIWKNQQLHIYNYPFPIAYYNNTLYRNGSVSSPQIFPTRNCQADGPPPTLLSFGDTTYPGSGSEKGVFSMKNNVWWSENANSTFTLGQQFPSCVPVWNFNYDSMRTKNNLFKNPAWQQWYGLGYPTLLSDIQANGNNAGNRPETGSVQSTVAGSSAFVNVATDDFSPTVGSPARNIGAALTTVKTAVTNSTTITVDRATFFFDGYCVGTTPNIECLGTGDTIRIGNTTRLVKAVNPVTNVVTLDLPVTAAANDLVSLAVHPIQGINLAGHTPDVGARAYVAAGSAPVANFTCTPLSGRVPLNVTCTDSSPNVPTAWAWTFGDTGTSSVQNPTRNYTSAGTYTVALTASNAFGGNTLTRPAYVKVSQTLFTTQTPVSPNATDGVPYELGMKFKSSKAGNILAIRYFKAASDTGTHVGRIWSATGTLLASVTFTGETASGWQEQALASPYTIAANTTYVVSVNVGGYFPITTNAFPPSPSLPLTNGSLSVVNDGTNGVFGTSGAFPTSTYQNSNYFRDVLFLPN